ncbi:UDP-N-acetylmuramoyl-L-alanyl-D-glutamate--2,6-diaminopimelate ligase [soil metagenome]
MAQIETEMRDRPEHVTPQSLADVAALLGVSAPRTDASITGISLASTSVIPGDLYAALKGASTHGAKFAADAAERGAVAILTDIEGAKLAADAGIPAIFVDDPRACLGVIASAIYERPSTAFTTIGITGTQGKTTTTYLAEAAIRGAGLRPAVIGTIGTRIAGVPVKTSLTTPEAPALQALFAVMREARVDVCAIEVSSHALVLGRADATLFDAAVFLNLGRDHLDFHNDLEDYFDAKAMLFTPEHAQRAVINLDDAYGRRLIARTTLPVTTFSTEGPADWRAYNIRAHRSGSDVDILGSDGRERTMSVPLAGAFNVSNAVAVVAALSTVGLDPDAVIAGIEALEGVPGRLERVDLGQPFITLIDYAHKPDALTAVLTALRPQTPGRLIIVMGAGGDRDRGKRPLMGEVVSRLADIVLVTDDNPRSEDPATIRAAVRAGATGNAVVIDAPGRRDAIAQAIALARSGDTLLIAGKGHETGQEIAGVTHPFDDRDVVRELLGGSS